MLCRPSSDLSRAALDTVNPYEQVNAYAGGCEPVVVVVAATLIPLWNSMPGELLKLPEADAATVRM